MRAVFHARGFVLVVLYFCLFILGRNSFIYSREIIQKELFWVGGFQKSEVERGDASIYTREKKQKNIGMRIGLLDVDSSQLRHLPTVPSPVSPQHFGDNLWIIHIKACKVKSPPFFVNNPELLP